MGRRCGVVRELDLAEFSRGNVAISLTQGVEK
jgi:hypothetical protein